MSKPIGPVEEQYAVVSGAGKNVIFVCFSSVLPKLNYHHYMHVYEKVQHL